MSKFNYIEYRSKRLEKLSPKEQESLIFDLINAFALMKNPADSALLLQDLLTEAEIRNLSKRLRIAKLILLGKTQEQIVKELHCSFATITKINSWLEIAGSGLKKVIRILPERRKIPKLKRIPGVGVGLPQIIGYAIATNLKAREKKLLAKFVEQSKVKSSADRDLKESLSLQFANKKKNF